MKKAIPLVALTIFMFVSSAGASPKSTKFGFVDLKRVLSESKIGAKAQKEYQVEVEQAQNELNKKKSKLEAQQETFTKQRESLSAVARVSQQEELIAMDKDLKRSFQDSQETLRRKNNQIVAELLQDIRKVVAEVGKKEGYTMILEAGSQSVLYADNKIDLTKKVIKRFDAKSQ